MTETCKSCKYFGSPKSGDTGVCRRYPPRYAATGVQNPHAPAFPYVKTHDYCGEYKALETTSGQLPLFEARENV